MFERHRMCVLLAVCLTASPAAAWGALLPLASQTYVSGLSSPVAFIQDPTDDTRQTVVEQGMAFAPDWADSGGGYVKVTNAWGIPSWRDPIAPPGVPRSTCWSTQCV